jgi:N-acetylglucosamine kinase-like BadF-type ATPase
MILIADAGATKIQWIVLDDQQEHGPFETSGFNPYFMDPALLEEIMEKELIPYLKTEPIREIYYYGAGCSTMQKCGIVEEALKDEFPGAMCDVQHDLLAAARALFNREAGIACILGTGSNSCLYDGNNIIENVTSLGYLFGDEGSGAYLGKLLLLEFLRGRFPENIQSAFNNRYDYSLENILDAVYNKPHPNQFLSSFALFAGEHGKDPFIAQLLERNFTDFFEEQVTKYTGYKDSRVGIIGSVGYHFQDIFRKVAEKYKVEVGEVVQNPIPGLVRYHRTGISPA